jgi:hypothetical protein
MSRDWSCPDMAALARLCYELTIFERDLYQKRATRFRRAATIVAARLVAERA